MPSLLFGCDPSSARRSLISCRSRAHAAWPLASRVGSAGAVTEMREVLVRREGGIGHDMAREKVCETVVRRARTWRRVRSWVIGGLFGSAIGDMVGWLSFSAGSLIAGSCATRPSGTNCDIAG